MADGTNDEVSQRAIGPLSMATGALTALSALWSLFRLVFLEEDAHAWELALCLAGALIGVLVVLFGRREYLQHRDPPTRT